MRQYGVHHQAWSPLASGRNNLLSNELLTNIGKKYNVSESVIRKWCRQYQLPNKTTLCKIIQSENSTLISN